MGSLLRCEQCASLNEKRPHGHRYLKVWLQLVRLFVEVRGCSHPRLSLTQGASSERESQLAVLKCELSVACSVCHASLQRRLFSLWNHKPPKALFLKLPWSQCSNKAKKSNPNASGESRLPRQLQSPLNNWSSGSTGPASSSPLALSQPCTEPAAREAFTEQ